MFSGSDSILTEPLPPMLRLKQLFLTEIDDNAAFTDKLLQNNRQIERLIIQKPGSFDFSILNPLENLKELVVSNCDTLIHPELINTHKKLELISLVGEDLEYFPSLIHLPALRWITIPPQMTQSEFDSFTVSHPGLEVMEIFRNDTIKNYDSLAKLSKLYGLSVVDTVMDYSTVKTLKRLKYLSLPAEIVNDTIEGAELKKSLPDTRVVANEGFCLGSGWLLLLIPLILIVWVGRFFYARRLTEKG
jgi:hypothetical protein